MAPEKTLTERLVAVIAQVRLLEARLDDPILLLLAAHKLVKDERPHVARLIERAYRLLEHERN